MYSNLNIGLYCAICIHMTEFIRPVKGFSKVLIKKGIVVVER